jgi:hypothetical protein
MPPAGEEDADDMVFRFSARADADDKPSAEAPMPAAVYFRKSLLDSFRFIMR